MKLHQIFILFIIVINTSCGVKGPPLPPIPSTPQRSEPQPASRVFPSPTPSNHPQSKGNSE